MFNATASTTRRCTRCRTDAGGERASTSTASSRRVPDDRYQAANYWVDVVYVNKLPADTTAPTVTVGLAPRWVERRTFERAGDVPRSARRIDPSTLTSTSFTLVNAQGQSVPGTLSYDSSTNTASLTPTNGARLRIVLHRHGQGRRLGRNRPEWEPASKRPRLVVHHRAAELPLHRSGAPARRATAASPDPNSVELGVRFRSDLAGYVTGVRFYKGAGNTGTHVGNLWTNTGTLLGHA